MITTEEDMVILLMMNKKSDMDWEVEERDRRLGEKRCCYNNNKEVGRVYLKWMTNLRKGMKKMELYAPFA